MAIKLKIEVDDQGNVVIDDLADNVKRAGGAVDAAGKKMESRWSKMDGALKRMGRTGQRVMSNLAKWSKRFLVAGVAAGFAAVTASITKAITTSAKFESMQLRLQQVIGSVKKATQVFKDLVTFSAQTPFQLPQIIEAASTLEAFGGKAKQLIKPIGDLAVFMGVSIVDAAGAFGRAFAAGAGAADILRERGVLALVKMRSGIQDLTKLTLPQFRQVLYDTLTDSGGRIAGGTAKLAATIEGKWSTLKDNIGLIFKGLGDEIIDKLDLKKVIDKWTEDLKKWRESGGLEEFAQNLAGAFNETIIAIESVAKAINKIVISLNKVDIKNIEWQLEKLRRKKKDLETPGIQSIGEAMTLGLDLYGITSRQEQLDKTNKQIDELQARLDVLKPPQAWRDLVDDFVLPKLGAPDVDTEDFNAAGGKAGQELYKGLVDNFIAMGDLSIKQVPIEYKIIGDTVDFEAGQQRIEDAFANSFKMGEISADQYYTYMMDSMEKWRDFAVEMWGEYSDEAIAAQKKISDFQEQNKKKISDWNKAIAGAFRDSFAAAAHDVSAEFNTMYEDVFGHARSVFQKMAQAFITTMFSAIAQVLMRMAAIKILGSFIPGIGAYLHQGGMVMHQGGMIPSMHSGGLRSDERYVKAQTGEFFTQRDSVTPQTLPVLQHINRTGTAPQSSVNVTVQGDVIDIQGGFVDNQAINEIKNTVAQSKRILAEQIEEIIDKRRIKIQAD